MHYMDLKFFTSTTIYHSEKGELMIFPTFNKEKADELLESIKRTGTEESGYVEFEDKYYFYYGEKTKNRLLMKLKKTVLELPEDDPKYESYMAAIKRITKNCEIGF